MWQCLLDEIDKYTNKFHKFFFCNLTYKIIMSESKFQCLMFIVLCSYLSIMISHQYISITGTFYFFKKWNCSCTNRQTDKWMNNQGHQNDTMFIQEYIHFYQKLKFPSISSGDIEQYKKLHILNHND